MLLGRGRSWRSPISDATPRKGRLGTWGYASAALQIIGFAIGGAAVFGYLLFLPYCEQCSRFLKKVGQRDRFTSAAEPFVARLKDFASLIAEQKFTDAIQFHAKKMGVGASFSSGHHLRTRIITRICSNCGINHLNFFGSKLDGDSWTDIPESEIGIFTNEKLAKVESD